MYSKKECKEALKRIDKLVEGRLTIKKYNKHRRDNEPGNKCFVRNYYSSWPEALKDCSIYVEYTPKKVYTEEDCINAIKRVGNKLGKESLYIKDYKEHYNSDEPSKGTIDNLIGWRKATERAGYGSDNPDYTVEKLKSQLWEYYNENNKFPKIKDIENSNNLASRPTYCTYFDVDSWCEVLEFAGFNKKEIDKYKFKTSSKNITKEKLLNQLNRYKDEVGKVPTSKDMTRAEYYSSATAFYDYFPDLSWDEIVQEAGLEKPKRELTRGDILDEIHRVIDELEEVPVSEEFDRHSKYSTATIAKHFDNSYSKALDKAGYEPSRYINVSKKELINDYYNLYEKLNRIPRYEDIKNYSKYSCSTYSRTFGGILNLRKEAGLPIKNNTTWIEEWAYDILDEMGIQFKKEFSIGSYQGDVMVDKQKNTYILELDGDYFHKEIYNNRPARGDLKRQSERDKFITNQGYHVIRVWESDIENNEEEIKQELKNIFIYGEKPPKSGNYININN